MINSGLDATSANLLYKLLKSNHRIRTRILMMDTNHNVLADLTANFVDGSVDVDSSADITRSAKVVLLDPGGIIGIDNLNSYQGTVFYNRMFQIWYEVSELIGTGAGGAIQSFSFPVFTGPITDFTRDGAVLNIECQGKEIMAAGGLRNDNAWPIGWPKVWVFQDYLSTHLGERNFSFSNLDGERNVLAEWWVVEAGENMWARFREMANGMGCQFFYNAYGQAILRPIPSVPAWTFDDTSITSVPDVQYDIDNLINHVRVEGGTPEGADGRYVYEVQAPVWHPLAPGNLARGGVPRYISDFIKDDSLVSLQQVIDVANVTLSQALYASMDVAFTGCVVPHLEEDDLVQINSSKFWGWSRVQQFSIPLVGDGEASYGFLSTSSYSVGDLSQGNVLAVAVRSQASIREEGDARKAEARERDKQAAKARAWAKAKQEEGKFTKLVRDGKKKKGKGKGKHHLDRGDK